MRAKLKSIAAGKVPIFNLILEKNTNGWTSENAS
jgi:hypothetical protein